MPKDDQLFLQAVTSFRSRKLDDAERQFKELLRREPRHLAALNIMGILLTSLQRYGEAEPYIRTALSIDKRSDATYYNYGVILKALNRSDDALDSFNRALAINSSVADTWNNRGTVLNDLKRYDDAIADFNKAIEIDPNNALALYNKGKSLSKLRRYDEAAVFCDKALALNPRLAEAWIGRGNICVALKLFDDAFAAYDAALALNPTLAEAWTGRGYAFAGLRRHEEALAAYDKALSLKTDLLDARMARAWSLAKLNRTQEAVAAYRDALDHGGDSEQIKYLLASLGAESPPSKSPQAYITEEFDTYAYTFDQHLIDTLKYRTPVLLAETIKRIAPSNALDILDLGCGTGLAGEALVPLKRTLTGIDLSKNMLNAAQKRGIYDQLISGEIVDSLQAYDHAFDLIVATDVFIYFGDLSPAFSGARRALRDDGIFCFSVEAASDGEFTLRQSLRYAHSMDYLQMTAEQNRFVVASIESHTIRQEFKKDVEGYLAVLRCAS